MLFDDGMDSTRCGKNDLKSFAQEQSQIALLHLPGRFAEGEDQAIILATQRYEPVVEEQLDWDQLERFPFDVQGNGINKFQITGSRQSPPGILLRGKVEVHNRTVLRQVQSLLAAPDLFELLFRELALLKQQIADFFWCGSRRRVHRIGTSISVLPFKGKTVVCAVGFVNVILCIVASATKKLVATGAPTGTATKTSPSLTTTVRRASLVW